MTVLRVEDLGVDIRGVQVVRNLSFQVSAGERIGLVGESGCGKSLTALAVMGLLPEGAHASGRVVLDEQDIPIERQEDPAGGPTSLLNRHTKPPPGRSNLLELPDAERALFRGDQLAMVFQEPMTALNPVMKVGRQIAEPLVLHGALSGRVARDEAEQLAERVELPNARRIVDAYPHQLSGGQRQRVMLAMAIACGPKVLIADEPTTALDVIVQARILRLLDQLVEEDGTSLIFITHDLAVISAMCDSVMVMYGGRVVEHGPTSQVFSHPRHPYTEALLAVSTALVDRPAPPKGEVDDLPTIQGSVPGVGRFPSGCVFRDRCPRATDVCATAPELDGLGHHVAACWHPSNSSSRRAGEVR